MNNMLHHYPPSAPNAPSFEYPVSHEVIARRAREIWIAQGRPHNCDVEIWLEAEAELVAIQQKRYRHPQLQVSNQ